MSISYTCTFFVYKYQSHLMSSFHGYYWGHLLCCFCKVKYQVALFPWEGLPPRNDLGPKKKTRNSLITFKNMGNVAGLHFLGPQVHTHTPHLINLGFNVFLIFHVIRLSNQAAVSDSPWCFWVNKVERWSYPFFFFLMWAKLLLLCVCVRNYYYLVF